MQYELYALHIYIFLVTIINKDVICRIVCCKCKYYLPRSVLRFVFYSPACINPLYVAS